MRLTSKTPLLCVLLHLRDAEASRVLILQDKNQEDMNMREIPDDERERPPINPRRQEVQRQLAVLETKAKALAERHGRLAAGIALTAAAAFGLGIMVYKRRQRKTTMGRMQAAIPDAVWALPEEIVAQLKKPLQRAAKAL